MKKKLLLTSLLCLAGSSVLFAQPSKYFTLKEEVPAYGYQNIFFQKTVTKVEEETAFERFQNVFFISLPFVLLTQFALTAVSYSLSSGDANFQLPHHAYFYVAASSLLTSTAIAIYDYRHITAEKNAEKIREERLSLRYTQRIWF